MFISKCGCTCTYLNFEFKRLHKLYLLFIFCYPSVIPKEVDGKYQQTVISLDIAKVGTQVFLVIVLPQLFMIL